VVVPAASVVTVQGSAIPFGHGTNKQSPVSDLVHLKHAALILPQVDNIVTTRTAPAHNHSSSARRRPNQTIKKNSPGTQPNQPTSEGRPPMQMQQHAMMVSAKC
jgi:hypothetical protein